ncbi:E3 ubiquitin-protein ligase Topors [Sciurus carolinensis]|uniref:RING-type E3 ubiquitin transferase n=1 Tax=Sciurus carolinensis TaxID=30640 RepID=A0AA41ST95_SCICA|nr:E3 ubiquitin-protein ligase Topors-like [Sciurus carolinensis]MBZ3872146.1 E3 ubiquitin-protein ligase Topors [Sciurus carolinensis]
MFREISVDLSSDCDCPNCLEGVKSESDSNSCSKKRADGSIYSRSRKQSISSFNNASFKQSSSTQCSSSGLESDNKEDSRFLPPEKENAVEFSKKKSLSMSPEDISTKIRPLKELTIQELLREFGEPNSTSLGHFRDQVVMKFRRALYYSGIWVTHVRGNKFEKHFSANYFKRNPGSLHRVIPWLKRELTAVYGDYGYTVKNILVSILHHMTKYDLDSESFIHLLEPYLHQHTHHFLHEFISFVQSPYNMETYDQRAIYHCPSIATEKWVKKKPFTSAPILPLPEDYTLPMSQHDTKQPKSTQNQWNEERPQSDLKYFLNGNYSLKHSKIPQVYHETTCKIHVGNKDKTESGNHNHIISTNNMLLDWATPKERDPGMLNCKKQTQEKKTIGIKLCPSHVQDQKSDTNARTFSTPVISNQVQPWKYNLREVSVLSLVQQANFQKKGEKNKYSDSSPKIFQRLPRERSLMNCKPRKRDPSWSGISDNILSPKRDGSKLSSFRKKKVRCKQSSSSVEVGSHSSRRLERRSRSNNNRSKSWCVGPRNRSISRESSNLSLGRNHRTEPVTQNMCCEPSKERNTPSYKSSYERISLTPVPYVKLSSAAGKRPNCPCKDEGVSPSVSHHNSSTCLEIEKHRSPRKQEMKHKTTSPRARRTRAIHRKNKRQHTYKQTPEEVSDALGDLDDIKQVSCLSECAPACRRQIQKNQKPSLLKGHESSSQE